MSHTTNDEVSKAERDYRKNLYGALGLLALILCAFFILKFLTELRAQKEISSSTITIGGYGEVQAVPDIANVYFTITKEGKTVKEAQDAVAEVEKGAIDSLKTNDVEEKDVQASNASFYPKYEYQSPSGARLSCNQWGCPPSAGKQVIIGYEASESINVKVRNTDSVGKIMQDLGTMGVTNLNGPDFSIDDEEALKVEARREAIENAKEKARTLARDLGVRLGKISSFSEDGGAYPYMFAKTESMNAEGDMMAQSAPAALPRGENTIASQVTITYEIR